MAKVLKTVEAAPEDNDISATTSIEPVENTDFSSVDPL